MDTLTPAVLVHFYDTDSHRIACGVSVADHRSTKHARRVTCEACLSLLGERPFPAAQPTDSAAHPA